MFSFLRIFSAWGDLLQSWFNHLIDRKKRVSIPTSSSNVLLCPSLRFTIKLSGTLKQGRSYWCTWRTESFRKDPWLPTCTVRCVRVSTSCKHAQIWGQITPITALMRGRKRHQLSRGFFPPWPEIWTIRLINIQNGIKSHMKSFWFEGRFGAAMSSRFARAIPQWKRASLPEIWLYMTLVIFHPDCVEMFLLI